MEQAPLQIELVPRSTWGVNLRSILTAKQWDIVRRRCYAEAGHRCQICNGVGPRHPVECHEIWSHDDASKVQRLEGVIALCPTCHQCKHLGRLDDAQRKKALAHLQKVNRWTSAQTKAAVSTAFDLWAERSKYEWRVDTDWVTGYLSPPDEGLVWLQPL